jgi:hypothetical protein
VLQINYLKTFVGRPKHSDQVYEVPSDDHPPRLGHGTRNQTTVVDSRPDQCQQVHRGSANLLATSSPVMSPGHTQKDLDDLKQTLGESRVLSITS